MSTFIWKTHYFSSIRSWEATCHHTLAPCHTGHLIVIQHTRMINAQWSICLRTLLFQHLPGTSYNEPSNSTKWLRCTYLKVRTRISNYSSSVVGLVWPLLFVLRLYCLVEISASLLMREGVVNDALNNSIIRNWMYFYNNEMWTVYCGDISHYFPELWALTNQCRAPAWTVLLHWTHAHYSLSHSLWGASQSVQLTHTCIF